MACASSFLPRRAEPMATLDPGRATGRKTNLSTLVQETRAAPSTQVLTFGMVSPKADLGFILLTDDLHHAHSVEKA